MAITPVNGSNGTNDRFGNGLVAGLYAGDVYAGDTLAYYTNSSGNNVPDGGSWGGFLTACFT